MVPLSMTLSDLWPQFQGHDIFLKSNIVKRRFLKTKLLLHKGKLYLTYGMVLCLVTLTDRWMRRAGLLASAELLVSYYQQDLPRSGKLLAQNQHFSPAEASPCTDSCEIWHSRGARGNACSCDIARQSVHRRGNAAPKSWKFLFFC